MDEPRRSGRSRAKKVDPLYFGDDEIEEQLLAEKPSGRNPKAAHRAGNEEQYGSEFEDGDEGYAPYKADPGMGAAPKVGSAQKKKRAHESDDDYEGHEEDEEDWEEKPAKGRKKRDEEDDEDWEEDKPKKKSPKKAAKHGHVGEAHGVLRVHSLEDLPGPLLDSVIDQVLDSHELRSFVHVAHDLLALRTTCRTLRSAVAPFMPALEHGLLAEAGGHQWPLRLSGGREFPFYTPELHALLAAPEASSDRDLVALFRFFKNPAYSEGNPEMCKWLKRNIAPRHFGLSPAARKAMVQLCAHTLNKAKSKATFSLRDADLDALPQKLQPNPMCDRYAPMRLFAVPHLQKASLARHGSVDGLHRFQKKCVSTAAKARATTHDKQGRRLAALKAQLTSRGLRLSPHQIEFYFQEYIRHEQGSVHTLVHRAYDLAHALHPQGEGTLLSLPPASHLGRAYIDDNSSAKRAHRASANKAIKKAAAKKTAAPNLPAPPRLPALASLVNTIKSAEFMATHTGFLHYYESAVRSFDDEDGYDSDGDDDYFMLMCFNPRYMPHGLAPTLDWPPVAVPNKDHGGLEMVDSRWQSAMASADVGDRPLFQKPRDRALREWMQAHGLHTPGQVTASTDLPEGLKELAMSLL